MSSKLQLDVCQYNQWWRRLVNAYEVWCNLQVKLYDLYTSATLPIYTYLYVCV